MKWEILREITKDDSKYEYERYGLYTDGWYLHLYAEEGTELHDIVKTFTEDDMYDLRSYLLYKEYGVLPFESTEGLTFAEMHEITNDFTQKVLSDFVYGDKSYTPKESNRDDYKGAEYMMKGFIVSSEDDIMAEIDFVTRTNAYKAMLTLRMRTDYTPEQDSEYYISVEDVLPITLFNSGGDEKEHSETELVLAKIDSIEEALWFLEKCEEEYDGEKLCDCSVEEVYYSYDFSVGSRGEIYKLKLDNGLAVSIREVYKS